MEYNRKSAQLPEKPKIEGVTNGDKTQIQLGSNSTPVINHPKGGGAINNIGEKFQATAATGTGNMSIPIALTPGRNGFTPKLSLQYDSGAGNGIFGIGWNINIPSIIRKTPKGLPTYFDNKEGDVFILAGSEDLIPSLTENSSNWEEVTRVDGNFLIKEYRPRTEGLFAKIEKHHDNISKIAHWKVTTKDNITSVYGASENSRIFHPDDNTKIFEWMLEYTYDEKGNIIYYEYKQENNQNINSGLLYEKNRLTNGKAFNKKYIKHVKYSPDIPFDPTNATFFTNANWHFQLVFDYGEHSADTTTETGNWTVRQDPFSTYRSGFELRTYRLCQRALLFHYFENDLGVNPYLVKSNDITYAIDPIASRVTQIQHICYEQGKTPESYPPVSFTYSEATIDPTIHEYSVEDSANMPSGTDGLQYRWADLFGEGLQGVLIEDRNAWYFKQNLGDENYYKDLPANETPAPEARLGAATQVAERPSIANLLAGNQQLGDLDGNGKTDLVIHGPGISGYYEMDQDNHWQRFQAFESDPSINWNDPNLRIIDINGDGFPDLLITEDYCFTYYTSKGKEGYEEARKTPRFWEEEQGPNIVFADASQSVYLADMSGDGLTDIVRIENGSVCYWPNMGYGNFGSKISMGNSPYFDFDDVFNQQRVRLGDVDGSGTTDIIYISNNDIHYYPNQSGNGFGEAIIINQRIPTHNLTNISLLDILGSGTQHLVWSSPVAGDHPPAIKFIDLMGGVKPYLLTESDNNMGSITRLKYVPSSKFYLRDQRAGTPWITKLPFPVQVVERIELYDAISRNRFVSKYAYHHGYFDGVEREFRGFGMVEQWDTETFGDFVGEGLFPPGYNASEEVLHVPPVLTKTWFHTGFYEESSDILAQYANEYWSGDNEAVALNRGLQILDRNGNALTSQPDYEVMREAARTLKGSPLRQEVYSLDGSANEANPYAVTENNYTLKRVQPRGEKNRRDNDYASFLVTPAETLAYQYERNPADPRIAHQLVLKTDIYGQALTSASIGYARRSNQSEGHSEQDTTLVTIAESTLINIENDPNFYRLGVAAESKNYQLYPSTAIATPGSGVPLPTAEQLLTDFTNAIQISFETIPDGSLQKRLIDHSRIVYYDENLNTSTPLPFGQVASHGLPFKTYQLALTSGLITNVLNENTTRVDSPVLSEGAYLDLLSDGNYWAQSGKIIFDSSHFYLPTAQEDPYGNQSTIAYDSYFLLPVQTVDALGNTQAADYDYRVLQPVLVTDPNGNRQAFEFDVRGMVSKIAVMGKQGDNDGDTLADPTSTFTYDLFRWMNEQKPNVAYAKVRETHQDVNTRWQESYAYSNGLGQVIMTKALAAPGLAFSRDANGDLLRDGNGDLIEANTDPRWVGNGRTVLDNKGNPVKQYEPYYSSTHEFENEPELVEYGVTPVIHYDPLGRAIRTELPDDTITKVEFTPWKQQNYDQNDTVLDSLWYVARNSPNPAGSEPTDPDERAAWLAAQHANTPQVVHLDALGRTFLTIDDNATDGQYAMTTELDIKGNPLGITDAKGRQSFTYTYNLLNQPIKTTHLDNGTRYTLTNVVGNPLRAWDNRSQQFRFAYDELQRTTHTHLTPDYDQVTPGTEALISRIVYGESETSPEINNLRGQAYLVFDPAGIVKNVAFDFKGNLLQNERQLALTYQTTPNWILLDNISNITLLLTTATPLLELEVFSTSSSYDALNRPVTLTQPDNSTVTPGYNEGGQLLTVAANLRGAATPTSFVQNIEYNARGQRNKILYGNNALTTYAYDATTFRLTRLLTTRNTGADILQDLNYTYDPVGNITALRDDAQQTLFFNNTQVDPHTKYTYDALYRLLSAEGREFTSNNSAPGPNDLAIRQLPETNAAALRLYNQSYEYDELGNILKMIHAATGGSWTGHYHYATNNYLLSTSPDGTQPTLDEYTYDTHGNMTAMPHLATMGWDYADRLQSADLGGGGTAYYTYDASGERVRKLIERPANKTEERIYIGGWEVYRERTNSNLKLERETLHILDDQKRIAVVDTLTHDNNPIANPTPQQRYQLSNHLESATLELDDTAAIISYEEYYPFGSTSYRSGRNTTETSLKRYRYVGKERDDETGLYYYGARYYAAWLARFISVDPLKDKYPQLASYQYASNDPVGDVDIDGLEGTKTKPKDLDKGKAGDEVKLPDGTTALMLEEVTVTAPADLLEGVKINREIKETSPEKQAGEIAATEGLAKGGEELTKGVKNYEAKQIEKGYATSQKGKVSKFPTEERQVKFYRADGTEEIHTIKQARNSGNFDAGDANTGIARTGETKASRGFKKFGEVLGMAGDAYDMATLLKAYSEGDISAVLAAVPFGLGLIFEDQINRSDALLSEMQQADFIMKLYSASPAQISDFLSRNPELGLELVYLSEKVINAVNNGEKIDLFDSRIENPFAPFEGGIPTLIDRNSNFIKIRITIYE